MLCHRVIERKLSVRETEGQVTGHLANRQRATSADHQTGDASNRSVASNPAGPDMHRLQEQLSDRLAAEVTVRANHKGRGRLSIEFCDLDQLDELLGQLGLRIEANDT